MRRADAASTSSTAATCRSFCCRAKRGLAEWLGDRGVEIVASLPHYRQRNTDAQRGDGAFEKSIAALRLLNAAGYGKGDPRRTLSLMTNPAGAFLSATQVEHRERMEGRRCSAISRITFDRLFALNNMPISRFLEWLIESGNLDPTWRASPNPSIPPRSPA